GARAAPIDNIHPRDKFTTLTFGAGTISTHTPTFTTCGSPTGLIFDQPFKLTGGTGAFAGATGGGRESPRLEARRPSCGSARSPSSRGSEATHYPPIGRGGF